MPNEGPAVDVQCSGRDCTETTQIDVSSGAPIAAAGWVYGPFGWRCRVCDAAEAEPLDGTTIQTDQVDALLNVLHASIESIAQANAALKVMKATKDTIERELIRRSRDEGAGTTFENDLLTVRVKEKPRAGYDPEQWQEIITFLGTNGLHDLVERRLNATKIKKMSEDGQPMPDGVWLESIDFCSTRRK